MPPEPDTLTPGRTPDRSIPWPLRGLFLSFFLSGFAIVGQITVVGKQVFDMTGRELDLGLLGLAEFLPMAFLVPFSGAAADRFDRRHVYAISLGGELLCALGLFFYISSDPTSVKPIFILVALFGVARSFGSPSGQALPIDLATSENLERVMALRSVAFQSGFIAGPVAMGFIFVVDPAYPYLAGVIAFALAIPILIMIPQPNTRRLQTRGGMQAIRDAREGLRFMRRQPVVFGAISLDLFAVLFGGIIALLPAIAENRLGVGAVGLGWLRAATGIGAGTTALMLSVRPVRRRVGRTLLVVIGIFGVMTIVIGLVDSYAIVFVALLVASAADSISVFIRSTLVPLATPEVMRGRVLAVERVFIGASNELGAAESGLTAAVFGLMGAILFGGVGTLAVVAIWWRWFPALRDVDRFDEVRIPGS
ncbi:MAG: MFS transporter [Actinobacteria bacterium]|nr:MFS transporter [Actinomycetota bacterium]